jgi:hypothetical protein
MTESERITQLESRVAKLESAQSALAAIFQRFAELIKGIGTKAADAADTLKKQ